MRNNGGTRKALYSYNLVYNFFYIAFAITMFSFRSALFKRIWCGSDAFLAIHRGLTCCLRKALLFYEEKSYKIARLRLDFSSSAYAFLSNQIAIMRDIASLLRKKQTFESLSEEVYKTGVLQKCSCSKILEKSFENNYEGVYLSKVVGLLPTTLLKMNYFTGTFQLFSNIYANIYMENSPRWLLLKELVIEVLRKIEVAIERCSSFLALHIFGFERTPEENYYYLTKHCCHKDQN